jgi:hypothetical protein
VVPAYRAERFAAPEEDGGGPSQAARPRRSPVSSEGIAGPWQGPPPRYTLPCSNLATESALIRLWCAALDQVLMAQAQGLLLCANGLFEC